MRLNRRTIGLAFSSTAVTAAEDGSAGALRTAVFELPADQAMSYAQAAGKALRGLLRQQGFSARQCVIGLEAGWIITKDRMIPACDAESLAGAASLAAEEAFPEAEDYALDYLAGHPQGGQIPLLIAAASLPRVQWACAVAQAAGLEVVRVEPTALALAAQACDGSAEHLMLALLPDRSEVVVQSRGAVRALRRLPAVGGIGAGRLAGEVRRLTMMLGHGGGGTLIDDAGASEAHVAALTQALGLTSAGQCTAPRAASAAALAARGEASGLDFLHSRLSAPKQARRPAWMRWAIIAAAACIVGLLALGVNLWLTARQVSRLEEHGEANRPAVAAAEQLEQDARFASGWYRARPRLLECLKKVTLDMPPDAIWLTSVVRRDGGAVILGGKSQDERTVLQLVERLRGTPGLSNVRMGPLRQGGGAAREMSFSITFEESAPR